MPFSFSNGDLKARRLYPSRVFIQSINLGPCVDRSVCVRNRAEIDI